MTSVLLRSARVLDGAVASEPVDLAVEDGTIVAIGPALDPGSQGAARVLDLDGRIVVPGLWDQHVHLGLTALRSRQLDLSGTTSAADAVRVVAARLESWSPADGPVVGYGFRDGLWPDAPHRDLLDAVAPAHAVGAPVVLCSADLHCGWLNGAALRHFAVGEHHDGVLREDAWYPVAAAAGDVGPETLERAVADVVAAAVRRGVVGVVELERAFNPEVWQGRYAAGQRDLRVVCGVYPPDLERVITAGYRTGDAIPGTDGLVTMGPLKVVIDGSLNTRTAYCHDPYPGHPGRGLLVVPADELVVLMSRAHEAGLGCAIHAIGDAANEVALDAFEGTGARGSIEHAQLVADADLARFARLDVVASVQPAHLLDDWGVAEHHWPGRTDRAFAFGGLLAAGARLALGSDAPVAPLDPWVTIAAAVHRTPSDREPWHLEQAISVEDALAASAPSGAALRVGGAADVVALDAHPHEVDGDALARMPVAMTMVGGRPTWLDGPS